MATIVRARLSTAGISAPPVVAIAMHRNEDRRVEVAVEGIPSGLTMPRLVWTGKLEPASDLDSAKVFQKDVTTATNIATVGRITDTGANGVAKATLTFVSGDSALWPSVPVSHQLWAVLSDGKAYCVLTGTLTADTPIPLALPASVDPTIPPAAQSALVLAWDAKRGTVVGPAWQNGSTSGADTNDATYVAGPPERYTFDADDFFHWGDVLDAVFTAAAGWTLLSAHEVSAADVAAAVRPVVHKDTDPAAREFWVGFISGRLRVQVAYGNGATGYDRIDATAAIAAGRRVIGAGCTPANPRATRLAAYVDGAAAATTHTPTGSDGTITDTTQPLRVGLWDGFQGPAAQRALYVYDRPLTAQEHADNRAWIVADGWS